MRYCVPEELGPDTLHTIDTNPGTPFDLLLLRARAVETSPAEFV